MDLRVEAMYLLDKDDPRSNILATFDIGVYDDEGHIIFYINKNMILLSDIPASDGEMRFKVRFPFRNQKNKDMVKDIIYFRDKKTKDRVIIEALYQYRTLYHESQIA